jgi:hypothetical protein
MSPAMTPRGILAYLAGLVLLVLSSGLAGVVILFAVALPARPQPEGYILLLGCVLVMFAAWHLLAAGVYRMLVHLHHAISRTDPAGDRRLRGRTLYLLGQLGTAMTIPITVLFLMLSTSDAGRRRDWEIGVIFAVLPAGFLLTLSFVALLGGLGIMLRDLFLRNQDIVEKREAERRRRIEEADEPQTEILPVLRAPADELREHIK